MKTILVRTSERMDFATCRQRWYWGWVEQLKTAGDEDPKLVFGDLIHRALAIYYKRGRKRGPHPAETFEQLCTAKGGLRVYSDGAWEDATQLGVVMLERYVEHNKAADAEYSVISSEQTFQVPIGTVLGYRVIVVGTIDGVWRQLTTKKIQFIETKTATAIKEDAVPMDEQIGSYWAFGPRWLRSEGILKPDETIDGVMFNWLRKAIPNPDKKHDAQGRVLNQDGAISKQQPPKYFHRLPIQRGPYEAKMVTRRVKQQARDMILARGNPSKYIYKNPGPQFMPNCKFCSFRDPCELHETGHDYQTMLKAEYRVWEPYADHELAERY